MEDIGCCLVVSKDRNQISECGCFESVETGLYDPMSPLLCGTIEPGDKITERKTKPRKDMQRWLSL